MSRCYGGHARVLKYSLICKCIWQSAGPNDLHPARRNKTDASGAERRGAITIDPTTRIDSVAIWRRSQGRTTKIVNSTGGEFPPRRCTGKGLTAALKRDSDDDDENFGHRLTILSDAFNISHLPSLFVQPGFRLWLIYSSNNSRRARLCRICHTSDDLFARLQGRGWRNGWISNFERARTNDKTFMRLTSVHELNAIIQVVVSWTSGTIRFQNSRIGRTTTVSKCTPDTVREVFRFIGGFVSFSRDFIVRRLVPFLPRHDAPSSSGSTVSISERVQPVSLSPSTYRRADIPGINISSGIIVSPRINVAFIIRPCTRIIATRFPSTAGTR